MVETPQLWHVLAGPSALAGVSQDWRTWLGDEYDVVQRFLAPENDLAVRYPCPEPHDDACPRRVVQHGDRYVAVCGVNPPRCDTVDLESKDVVVFTLKMDALLKQMAAALIPDCSVPEPIAGVPGAWGMGEIAVGDAVGNLAFVRPGREDGYEAILLAACGRFPKNRPVFLVPSAPDLSAEARSLLARLGAGVLVAPDILVWKTLRFASTNDRPFEHVEWIGGANADGSLELQGEEAPIAVVFSSTEPRPRFVPNEEGVHAVRDVSAAMDHVVDATGPRATATSQADGAGKERPLDVSETSMLLAYLILHAERRNAFVRPEYIALPRLRSQGSRRKKFDSMRNKIDARRENRQEYRLFSQQRPFETGPSEYAFNPDSAVTYCFVFRYERYRAVREAMKGNPSLKIR